jgi:hypothetical protein
MPDFEAEAKAAVSWLEHPHLPHRHAAPQTPAQPEPAAQAAPNPRQEAPMFTIAEIEAEAKAFVAKFEQIDKAALARLDAATSNPETDDVLSDLAKLAGLPIPPGTIAGMANGLKVLLGLYVPEQPAAPAQPQQTVTPAVQ